MSQIGQDLKKELQGTTGGAMDALCDKLAYANVTNINTTWTGSRSTLSKHECGTVILGNAVGSEQAIGNGFNVNLPTPERGLWYKFILRAPSIANNSSAAITVTATSDGTTAANIAVGHVAVNNASTNVVAAVDILTFVHNAATCGDHATFYCDGTNWFVNAVGDAAGSVTLA